MHKPHVWPVIHYLNHDLAIENADIAAQCGVEGVFLIEMVGDDEPLLDIAKLIKHRHPGLKVGVNHLTWSPRISLEQNIAAGLDATWTDRSGVTSGEFSGTALAIGEILKRTPAHLFFGSVAFKYQAVEQFPGFAACKAASLGMIPTTSGVKTGVAADLGKLQGMHAELAEFADTQRDANKGTRRQITDALGLASGVTPENVVDVIGLVTHILVATGVSLDEHRFDYEKLARLMGRINTFVAENPEALGRSS